jgi:hypothetical protein
VEEGDYRAGGFADDLVDQIKRVLGAGAESNERDVGPFAGGHGPHVLDVDLSRDHLVTERDDHRRYQSKPVVALVGDQDA